MKFQTLKELKLFLIRVVNLEDRMTLTDEQTSFTIIPPRVDYDYGFELKTIAPGDPFRVRFYFVHRPNLLVYKFTQEIAQDYLTADKDETELYLGELIANGFVQQVIEDIDVDYAALLLEAGDQQYVFLEDGGLILLENA